ncbi:MAG: cyclic lactone autoinducer peptide [Syntrophomonas sp.]|nr:cyclic lactone autoinducer peptide [Syntrophomonas sp.]
MLTKFRVIACTVLATIFTVIAAGAALGCPYWNYQPELPKRD